MQRIGRHLFTILAAASLLFCLAVLADWCTHPWRMNCFGWERPYPPASAPIYRGVVVVTQRGLIRFRRYSADDSRGSVRPPSEFYFFSSTALPGSGNRSWSGLMVFRFDHAFGPDYEGIDVILPSWFLAALFAILPAVRIRGMLRDRKRHRAGLCPTCGYDLRAHAAGERCPECGTAVGR